MLKYVILWRWFRGGIDLKSREVQVKLMAAVCWAPFPRNTLGFSWRLPWGVTIRDSLLFRALGSGSYWPRQVSDIRFDDSLAKWLLTVFTFFSSVVAARYEFAGKSLAQIMLEEHFQVDCRNQVEIQAVCSIVLAPWLQSTRSTQSQTDRIRVLFEPKTQCHREHTRFCRLWRRWL